MDWRFQQLRKPTSDRMLDGICGGLGEYTPVPALAWRVLFVLATLASGAGLLVYVLMWWLMPAAGSTGAPAGSDWNLQALRRSVADCQVAGVCGGLGAYTPIPAWLWRVAFVALIFAGGVGLLAYVLLWLCVPGANAAIADTGNRHPTP
jgi:phage shock protein PspC (stress-responsive transcriptional regulator)